MAAVTATRRHLAGAEVGMQHAATPVLLMTQDDFLWQHWYTLDSQQWLPARGMALADLRRWREHGRALAILDIGLPGLPDWQAHTWRPLLANMQVVAASVRPTDAEGMQAIMAGAVGYCHAYAPAATLDRVLQAVASGSVWMGASLMSRLLRQVDALAATPVIDGHDRTTTDWQHDALSEREHTIARHVAQGESNSAIATTLGISERTVKAHLTSIFDKLGIHDRLQLALRVHGVLDITA